MKQIVLFTRQVTLGNFDFQPNQCYTFIIIRRRRISWLCYQGQLLITLSYFATLFADQNYAQWVDDVSQVA